MIDIFNRRRISKLEERVKKLEFDIERRVQEERFQKLEEKVKEVKENPKCFHLVDPSVSIPEESMMWHIFAGFKAIVDYLGIEVRRELIDDPFDRPPPRHQLKVLRCYKKEKK